MLGLQGATWHVADSSEKLPEPCNGVVVDLHAEIPAHWQQFLTSCALAGIPVYHYKHIREAITGRLKIDRFSENMLGSHNPHDGYRKVKRIVDFVTAAVAIVLLGPLLLVVAALIRLDSPGPVLYRQERVGLHGRRFTLLKFRSMRIDAEAAGPSWASQRDPRVTRVGGFIRTARIDELPQLINVLRCEMSLVGPRPERPFFVEQLRPVIPRFDERTRVLPGITGWAQINYPYGASVEDAFAKLAYDLYYVHNHSLWLDLRILFATIRVVLFGIGAR